VGFGPWAPGTWGALLAVVGFALFLHRVGPVLYVLAVVGVSAAGVWASGAVEAWFGRHDDGRIVIDEVAGQLVTLAPLVALHGIPLGIVRLPGMGSLPGGGIDAWWLLVVTGFVAFRWFDIRKPGPVKWAEERFEGGAGVMADDLVAGVLGALVVMAPAYAVVVSRLRALVVDAAWVEPLRAAAEAVFA
jgi:phosphatidylglycerophosphatase A